MDNYDGSNWHGYNNDSVILDQRRAGFIVKAVVDFVLQTRLQRLPHASQSIFRWMNCNIYKLNQPSLAHKRLLLLYTQVCLQKSQAADGALTPSACDGLCARDLRDLFDVREVCRMQPVEIWVVCWASRQLWHSRNSSSIHINIGISASWTTRPYFFAVGISGAKSV